MEAAKIDIVKFKTSSATLRSVAAILVSVFGGLIIQLHSQQYELDNKQNDKIETLQQEGERDFDAVSLRLNKIELKLGISQ